MKEGTSGGDDWDCFDGAVVDDDGEAQFNGGALMEGAWVDVGV